MTVQNGSVGFQGGILSIFKDDPIDFKRTRTRFGNSTNFYLLMNNSGLNHIIYSRVGDYCGETVYQILKNKIQDLQYNPNILGKCTSSCFWALHSKQEEWIRKKIVENMLEDDSEEIYLVLSYTGSKKQSGESPDEFRINQYALDRNRKTTKYEYPNEFKPAKIAPGSNIAFLISELYYAEEDITGSIIEEAYSAFFETTSHTAKINSTCKQKPFYLATLKEKDREKINSKITESDSNSNKTGLIIAKLANPFVVAAFHNVE